jgi:hypothetical protein
MKLHDAIGSPFGGIDQRKVSASGLEPLTPAPATSDRSGVAGVCKPRVDKPVSLLRFAACCTVLRSQWYQSGIKRLPVGRVKWCQKCVDEASPVPLRSTGNSEWGRPTGKRSSSHSTRCNGHWYLDPVLGLRDPPQVWLGLTDERPRLKVHGLAYLLEEPLVHASRLHASRCLAHQHPTQTLTDVLV